MTTLREDQVNIAVAADAAAGRFGHWGRSTTRDEHTGAPVLPAGTVRRLHAIAGITTDGEVGNAGLIHVYGYLLSTATTPYGPKHARWTEGGVARALGLDPALLLPDAAPASTPIEVLTPVIERLLSSPPATALVVDETGERLHARTVLLPGEPSALGRGREGALLVYGVGEDPAPDGLVLPVTVFPIGDATASLAEIEAEPPRLRYNAADRLGRARSPLDRRRIGPGRQ